MIWGDHIIIITYCCNFFSVCTRNAEKFNEIFVVDFLFLIFKFFFFILCKRNFNLKGALISGDDHDKKSYPLNTSCNVKIVWRLAKSDSPLFMNILYFQRSRINVKTRILDHRVCESDTVRFLVGNCFL